MYNPEDETLGGYTKRDGTVEFYGRIKAFLRKDFVVVDLGAGRGAWYVDYPDSYRKSLRTMKGHVARVIGCDVDEAVLSNPSCDENVLMVDGRIPLADASADVVIADCVLEHIADPPTFYAEVNRILKPGGYFCAKTPHTLNYVSLAARLVKNSMHDKVLSRVQPGRKAMDVFPTAYKLNTLGAITKYWRPEEWENYSYLYVGEPWYYFGSRTLYRMFSLAHRILPEWLTGGMLVFVRKRVKPAS
jgi:SAM-dependent methyltransferase